MRPIYNETKEKRTSRLGDTPNFRLTPSSRALYIIYMSRVSSSMFFWIKLCLNQKLSVILSGQGIEPGGVFGLEFRRSNHWATSLFPRECRNPTTQFAMAVAEGMETPRDRADDSLIIRKRVLQTPVDIAIRTCDLSPVPREPGLLFLSPTFFSPFLFHFYIFFIYLKKLI